MPVGVGCYKQMSAIKEGVIIRLHINIVGWQLSVLVKYTI